jgi:dienelactone hydrolase
MAMGIARVRQMVVAGLLCGLACTGSAADAPTRQLFTIRNHTQVLHVYGTRGGLPVIVSSGDGGWMHLAPHVAELLASRGCFVVGFDVKAYLAAFTSSGALHPGDVPPDYQRIVEFAAQGASTRPLLVGVSEGAGLSVLAATDARLKPAIGGVIALGLPDINELGWRWSDAIIYLTHGVPHEPSFSTAAIVDRVSPLPLAAIHSTHDEFVPAGQVQQVLARASDPKRLWMIDAADHRFSDKLADFDQSLLEAMRWVAATAPRQE